MTQRAFGIETPLADQLLDQRMIHTAGNQLAGTEMIKPRIAAMSPIGPVGLHHEDDRGAVRILLAGETGQLDDDMRFINDAAQQVRRTFGRGRKGLEILAGLEDDLLSRHRTAGMPTHTVGQHRHEGALAGWMSEHGGPVLLLIPVARVLGYTGFRLIALLGRRGFGRRKGRWAWF